ncbi:MAG: accessory Sec system translocase SecA2 [Pseudonocardiaceae bacterium]|nr:accessory Sec system translocase SecA2 [Pseudonocardiaceae bacterium]
MSVGRFRDSVRRVLGRPGTANVRRYHRVVNAAGAREAEFRGYSVDELRAAAARLRELDGDFGREELAEFCALGREATRRTLGERPFDVQLLGTLGLLTGHVVEMATGEGKTLSGALAAAGFVFQGRQVHVVSVNDYLAGRDAEWMGQLYALLGVSVAAVGQHATWQQRRDGYATDVTYVSVSEVGFDVLRDRLRSDAEDLVLPAPDVVIVDEADSVLIDEARVPLVLAGAAAEGEADQAIDEIVRGLAPGRHYEMDDDERNVFLTDAGLARVERRLGGIDLYTSEHGHRLTQVHVALHAHALLRRDVDYLVRNGKVELINVARGRVARLQRWPDGLQAAVETKEGLATSPTGDVLDCIIVQALIGRYRTVCGMTGTALAVAEQLAEFYKLKVGRIPTNLPCVREDEPDRLYATLAEKEAAIVDYIVAVHATGRPILLGTLDVAESERLHELLAEAGVHGVVLNAKNDAEEAAIVARAGEYRRVTISTQMAGRGTDIRLGDAAGTDRDRVAELGGLCVVGSGRYHTARLDDQLRGRAGRQGDPGESVFFTSLEDDLVTQHVPDAKTPKDVAADGRVADDGARWTVEHAQRVAEGAHLETHRTTWRYNQLIETQRTIVLEHRDKVLRGELASRRLAERCPERYAELRNEIDEDALDAAARLIVLYHLDRCWTEHLALLTDVREGIHLRALGRETPLDEFHRIAVAEFGTFFENAYTRSAETFADAEITADGVDLASMGLQRPTSTWTYMVTDTPFGSEHDRILTFLRTSFRRDHAGHPAVRGGAFLDDRAHRRR